MYLKLAVTTFYIYKEKLLNNFSKILKNILQLLTGLQFDTFCVIETRIELELVEITRFLNYFSGFSFAI